ncbi:MAG: hypothetical protein SPF89_05520 [Sphaerochaetaceae bacterium]|nr:hypothetical protein [Spirochaetales bacterium]MDY5499546.1 hypothetical protein [Sphaerochaetaceae bacterium]
MSKPTVTTWLNQLVNDGIPQAVKLLTLRITREGEGWLVDADGYTQVAKEQKQGEGEPVLLSGQYPLELDEKNTAQMEAVAVGRKVAEYLQMGACKDRLLAMEYITILDADGKSHLLYEKEQHKIHNPATSERRMNFLLILGFIAVLLPSFEPSMGIFGILVGAYGIWLTHGIYKRHRKARTAFVLDILGMVIGLWTMVLMLLASRGGAA